MIVYFADRQFNIVGQASTNLRQGLRIVDDNKHEYITNGVVTFEFEVKYNASNRMEVKNWLAAGNYVLRSSQSDNEFYTIITSTDDEDARSIKCYCEDAGLDLLNEVVGAYTATSALPLSTYVNMYVNGSGFEIGINEVANYKRTLEWTGESTVTERLASIATSFDCEVSYSFEVKNLVVTKMYVNFWKKRGKDIQENLRVNKEIESIVEKDSIENLATALLCTGGTASDSSDNITLIGYSYDDGEFYSPKDSQYLYSRSALKNWGKNGTNQIVRQFSYETTSQSELCNRAIAELKTRMKPEKTYTVKVIDLPDNVGIGDIVNLVDNEGEIYVSTRLLELTTSVSDDKIEAVFGDFVERQSGINAQLQKLAAQFSDLASSRAFYTWFAYADDSAGSGISLDPANKTYLGTAVNQTTSTVDITDPSIFTWVQLIGESGSGITMMITSSNGILFKDGLIDTVLTAHIYKDGAELNETAIAGIGTIYWKDSSGTTLGTGITYTLTDAQSANIIAELEG